MFAAKDPTPLEIAQAERDGHTRARPRMAAKVAEAEKRLTDAKAKHARDVEAVEKAKTHQEGHDDDPKAVAALITVERAEQLSGEREKARQADLDRERATLADLDAKILASENVCKRVELEEAIRESAATTRARGARVVDLVTDLFDLVTELQKDVARENAIVTEARKYGSTVDYTDGLQIACGLADALLRRGHDIGTFATPTGLRGIVEAPAGAPSKSAVALVRELAGLVALALTNPPSVHGTSALRNELAAWGEHRSHAAAHRAQAEAAEADRHRTVSAVARDESARLSTLKVRADVYPYRTPDRSRGPR